MKSRTSKPSWLAWAVVCVALQSFSAIAAEPVSSVEIVESSAFLEGYWAASEAQSPAFYDLYSDRAVIHARIADRDKGIAFQGRAFKAWGRQLLKEGRSGPDASIFRDVTVEQRGGRLLIRAKRYSTTRCYWDPSYQVGIEREGSSYRIVDERLTTNPSARCMRGTTTLNAQEGVPQQFPAFPTIGGVRQLDPQSTAPWHPLSQQELADKAMRLAQQMSAARAALAHSNGSVSPAFIATGSLRAVAAEAPNAASVGRGNAANDLRVTPED